MVKFLDLNGQTFYLRASDIQVVKPYKSGSKVLTYNRTFKVLQDPDEAAVNIKIAKGY